MALKIGTRGRIAPFLVMDVLRAANERQAAGAEVLHLEIGQPGTPAPAAVREAAKRAIDEEAIGYTDAFGLPSLRRRIARHYAEHYGVSVDPARIAVTPGSSGGFLLAFLASFDPGDRVALAAPGYPAYRNILTALGLEPVLIETGEAERYQPSPALLEQAQRDGGALAGVIVASPSNPTGTMLGAAEMAALADWCRDAGVRLISDEIYHGIGYGRRPVCALEQDDQAIVVNSFSKYYSMTGWRLGWLVLPESLVRPVECLGQNLFISAHAVSQHAGIAAFDCTAELDGYVAGYARNRALLLERLPAAGLVRLAPADGAFYLYADIGHLTDDSQAFCRRLLEETGVAIAPGVDFDPLRGHHTVRLSFAGPERDIALAAERLTDWLQRNG